MTAAALPTDKPACARLAAALRELRARTGISIAALAARTPYSKSSWARYLNGKQLAPRQAVEALCATAREPPGRLLALWELAEVEWSGRAYTAASPADRAANDRPSAAPADSATLRPIGSRRSKHRNRVVFAAVCAVGLALGSWAVSLPFTSSSGTVGRTAASSCRAHGCSGRDPLSMGCAATEGDVRDLGTTHRTSTGAQIAFRYGTRCHATWAILWNARVGDVLDVSVPGNGPQQVRVTDDYEAAHSLVTPMLGSSSLTGLRACFAPAGGGHTECFRP